MSFKWEKGEQIFKDCEVHEVLAIVLFREYSPFQRVKSFTLKDMDQKDPSQSLFCGLAWGTTGKSLAIALDGDQAMARDEEALPHLQRMGCFTKFDAHLCGSGAHSHAHAWLHTSTDLRISVW